MDTHTLTETNKQMELSTRKSSKHRRWLASIISWPLPSNWNNLRRSPTARKPFRPLARTMSTFWTPTILVVLYQNNWKHLRLCNARTARSRRVVSDTLYRPEFIHLPTDNDLPDTFILMMTMMMMIFLFRMGYLFFPSQFHIHIFSFGSFLPDTLMIILMMPTMMRRDRNRKRRT